MSKRGTRYVYDSGKIYRMTERQYRRYIAAGCHRPVTASDYGTWIGIATFNATRATLEDFRDAHAALGLIKRAGKRTP